MFRSISQLDLSRLSISRNRIRRVLLTAIIASSLASSPNTSSAQTAGGEISRLEREANSALAAQKPEVAIADYKRILTLDPANAGAHSNLGLAYYLSGDFALAAGEFNIALRGRSDQWNIMALCGLSEANIGRNSDAVAHLDEAFQHTEDADLHLAVGKRLFSLLFEKGDLERAAEVVARLQQMQPNNIDVLYAAHQVYSRLGSKIFLTVAQLAPESARMYQLRGDRLAHMGKLKAAIAAYRRAIDSDPHLPGAHFQLAELLNTSQDSSDRAQAEGEYLKEIAIDPQDEKSECRLGDIHVQRSDLPGAIQHYKRALQLQPDDPEANEGYGMALLAADSPLQARKYLKRAIELDPTNITAHYHLSQVSRKTGDPGTAKREMDEFLKRKAEREQLKHTFDDLPIQPVRETSRQQN